MSELVKLFEKYSLDKLYNKYDNLYVNLFESNKHNVKKLLEIGIGTTDPSLKSSMHYYKQNDAPSYEHGNSLRAWRDYFINAQVYGIDIDEKTMFSDDRIETFCSSSMDEQQMNKIMSNIGKMDIIIEDGLHTMEANIKTLQILFPYLYDGGIYVIEDVNQWNDWFIDEMIRDERFLNILNGKEYTIHSGFNEHFTRIITIKK